MATKKKKTKVTGLRQKTAAKRVTVSGYKRDPRVKGHSRGWPKK